MILRVARFAELDASTLYGLLRLRCDVFVVEQRCPYPELDGRDVEPDTRHCWMTDPTESTDGAARPTAYLRVLADPGGTARIGRVCTAMPYRGQGVARTLMTAGLAVIGPERRCVLDAQAHLAGFYESFGFTVTGPQYLDEGIPHLPMARPAGVLAERPGGGGE